MSPQRIRILAIDDDETDGVLMRRLLQRSGELEYEFTLCQSGSQGLAALKEGEFDIVLLDHELGAEDGLMVLGAIRHAGYDVPVIFLTGHADDSLVVEAIHAGAADYISKAVISSRSLTRAILNALEKHQLQGLLKSHQENLERMNFNLQQRNREIERFYHTVSHELKTPLTSAGEFVSLVLEGVAGPVSDAQREFLGISQNSLKQMRMCIDDLIDVARIETGKLTVRRELTAVALLISQSVTAMSPQAKTCGIHLQYEGPVKGLEGEIDPNRITQVVHNLLTNAFKFTEEGGTVTVSLSSLSDEPERALVSVTDSGRGIPASELTCIFERLHQVRKEDHTDHGGLGLGLSICKELVELHGSVLEVSSIVGEGSTFSFTLPINHVSPAPSNVQSEVEPQ